MARRRKKDNTYKYIILILSIVLCFYLFQNFAPEDYKKFFEGNDSVENNKVDNNDNKNTEKENKYSKINGFKESNLDRYKKYEEKFTDLSNEEVVKGVNLDFDKVDIAYSTLALEFTKEKYYKLDNLSRYISYSKNNSKLSNKEIIRRVHASLDKEFYEDAKDADFSKGLLILVNKFNYLGDYEPDDLVTIPSEYGGRGLKASSVTVEAYKKMYDAMKEEGMKLIVNSAYRSFDRQTTIYNNYKKTNGFEWTEKWSARPGYSEHQTGLAMDLVTSSSNFNTFENTKEYKWLKDNSYKFGFILRYPSDDYYLTGYSFESWHYRYVGVEVATKIYNERLTFEEYYEYYVK